MFISPRQREQREEERTNREEHGTVQRGLNTHVPKEGSGRSEKVSV